MVDLCNRLQLLVELVVEELLQLVVLVRWQLARQLGPVARVVLVEPAVMVGPAARVVLVGPAARVEQVVALLRSLAQNSHLLVRALVVQVPDSIVVG